MRTTEFKAKAIAAAASATSFVLGDTHFVLKSSADAVASLESILINKMTGKPKRHVIEDRHNHTEQTQELVKLAAMKLADRFRSLTRQSSDSDIIADDIIHDN